MHWDCLNSGQMTVQHFLFGWGVVEGRRILKMIQFELVVICKHVRDHECQIMHKHENKDEEKNKNKFERNNIYFKPSGLLIVHQEKEAKMFFFRLIYK